MPISPIANPVTLSFAVKVRDKVASLVVELLATALDNQTKRIHGEQVGEVDLSELVRSLISRKE